MGKMGNNWATSYRNSRAVLAIFGLVCVLIFSLIIKYQDEKRIFLRTETVAATLSHIKEISSETRDADKQMHYLVELSLPDSKKIHFTLLQKPPEVGTPVPILIDIYADGTNHYRYNLLDWVIR